MKNKYLACRSFYLKIAGLSFLFFLLIVLFNFAAGDVLIQIDEAISLAVYNVRNEGLNIVMQSITFLGNTWTQVAITIGFMLISGVFLRLRFTPWWYGITALLGSYFLNRALKDIFERLRPPIDYHLVVQDGFSFPSGHDMGATIMFGGIFFILSFYAIRNEKTRFIIFIALLALVLLIGFSRIYLGVHYFSDVIGGFFAGASWLSLSISFYYHCYDKYNQRVKGE